MQTLYNKINNQAVTILLVLIFLLIIAVIAMLVVKYNSFEYDAIDLGIYNQVMYNSTHGDLFGLSIHPHSYLGDHFELFLLALLPFYFIFKSPITLLALQVVVVLLSAIPLYYIARRLLTPCWSLAIACAFLFSPFVLNTIFFEFHILPFAIFFLLAAFYFYQNKKFIPFVISMMLALTVREDVALVTLLFGLLAILDKRKLRWILLPIIASGAWFVIALQFTGYFSGYQSYKFLSFYGWLGGTSVEIITNFFAKPWLVAQRFFTINNLFLAIGLVLPLVGLPLLRLKYLAPTILIVIQLFLTGVSSTVILQTHYASLLLPFIFIATVYALSKIITGQTSKRKVIRCIQNQKPLFGLILATAIVYSFITFSPFPGSLSHIWNKADNQAFADARQTSLELIGNDDAVISSFSTLPQLSSRKHIYSLHYAFIGKKQFSDESYEITTPIDWLVIDFSDFITYQIQAGNISSYRAGYNTGAVRINNLIEKNKLGLRSIIDSYAIYEAGFPSTVSLIEKNYTVPSGVYKINNDITSPLSLIAAQKTSQLETSSASQIVALTLFWQANEKLEDDYVFELRLRDDSNKIVYQKKYPIGYGLYPTSQWDNDEAVATHHWFLTPNNFSLDKHTLEIQIQSVHGYAGLNGIRSTKLFYTEANNIGSAITIPYNTL